jgi:uncharacterized protein (DUF2236 family)
VVTSPLLAGWDRLARLVPGPNEVAARVFPQGIPLVRDEFLARTGLFRSALDPDATPGDPGLFGPESITWRVVGHVSVAIAGLRAALLQTLSLPVPTAVDSTGTFYEDFMGRVGRTGAFVQAQNLGSMDEVYRAARRVRAVHRRINGVGRDGVHYDATDPHQIAWVSVTLTESFLVVTERFGLGRLGRADADAFVRQQSTHAALLDTRVDIGDVFADPDQRAALQTGSLPLPLIEEGELPTTRDGLRATMRAWDNELSVNRLTRALLDGTVGLSTVGGTAHHVGRAFVLATLSTLTGHTHELIAPQSNRLLERAAADAVQVPLATLHALVGELPSARAARARAAQTRAAQTRATAT